MKAVKTLPRLLALSLACLLIMTAVDYYLGTEAEFLNAFSALERLLGQQPSSGESLIATKFGAVGEFVGVVLVNILAGGILTVLLEVLGKDKK